MNINYYGCFTLLKKETLRFIKVYHQTIFAPVVNALLLLAIFSLAFGQRFNPVEGVSFQVFMAAGLIMMVTMQNAFANSSSSFVMGKVLGHLIDCLIPPISAGEMLFAIVGGAILRGFAVGIVSFTAISLFIDLSFYSFAHVLFYMLFATMFLGLFGVLTGILSETFDHMSAITSYFITPLTFLSGTFYSINNLPPFWREVTNYNPFFYMIDGFRYGLTGHHDSNLTIGATFIIAANVILAFVIYQMLKKGYRIKQ
ncbi:MAG: ABC transporter permease [Proteobacteria bacterium]|nr:ABC transporter permease [Pseudomonadota bacterium]